MSWPFPCSELRAAMRMESNQSMPSVLRAGGTTYSLRSEECTGQSKVIDKDQVLCLLNEFRSQHGAPPLEWSETCARQARLRANHRTGEPTDLGENLAQSIKEAWRDPTAACIQALRHWQKEEAKYDYGKPGLSSYTDHFTAIVWRSTTHVGFGVGKALYKGNTTYYVAAYFSPKGNQPGEYGSNVLPKNSILNNDPYIAELTSATGSATNPPPTFIRADAVNAEIKELGSADGRFRFVMQENRNIVVLHGNRVLWDSGSKDASEPPANGPFSLLLQSDGNLVAYEAGFRPFWSSGTSGCGRGPYTLTMQDDGHCVLYDGDWRTRWATPIRAV